ncbi:MAG: phenylalanine--tRNA ligase subunit alpha [Bacteroidota bacterium]
MSKEKTYRILEEIQSFDTGEKAALEDFRIRFLGKKGIIRELFTGLKEIDPEQRKEFGQVINELKKRAEEKVNSIKETLESAKPESKSVIDLTRPAEPVGLGARHPVSIIRKEMIEIFERIGFTISEGPEIENDWYNFSALNIPEDHPARDMQDTFFFEKDPDILLRTHTSPQQIRVMGNSMPPIRIICPGRVYRNETISARSHCIFHQVEGLYVDEGVSFVDLKQTLYYFAREMYGGDTKIRFRPSYFPFTEPSAEMDISCVICRGNGCPVCKYSGWVEILGCGMVDPTVLENCKIDSDKYTGYAFGLGIERPAMLKYGIDDIRLFFENDVRFLEQFKAAI